MLGILISFGQICTGEAVCMIEDVEGVGGVLFD